MQQLVIAKTRLQSMKTSRKMSNYNIPRFQFKKYVLPKLDLTLWWVGHYFQLSLKLLTSQYYVSPIRVKLGNLEWLVLGFPTLSKRCLRLEINKQLQRLGR